MRFCILTAVMFLRVVTACGLIGTHQRFLGTYCLKPWRWLQCVLPQLWILPVRTHSDRILETNIDSNNDLLHLCMKFWPVTTIVCCTCQVPRSKHWVVSVGLSGAVTKNRGKEEEDMKTLTIYPPFFYIALLWHERGKKEISRSYPISPIFMPIYISCVCVHRHTHTHTQRKDLAEAHTRSLQTRINTETAVCSLYEVTYKKEVKLLCRTVHFGCCYKKVISSVFPWFGNLYLSVRKRFFVKKHVVTHCYKECCEVWGSHGVEFKDCCLLGCCVG
jgi:hypothetical protein